MSTTNWRGKTRARERERGGRESQSCSCKVFAFKLIIWKIIEGLEFIHHLALGSTLTNYCVSVCVCALIREIKTCHMAYAQCDDWCRQLRAFSSLKRGKTLQCCLIYHGTTVQASTLWLLPFNLKSQLGLSLSLSLCGHLRSCGLAVLGRLVKPQLKTHLKKGATFFRPWQKNFFGQNARNGENGQINYWAKWRSKKENWKMETAASFKKQFDGEPRLECHERTANGAWAERGTNCAYDMCVARLRTEVVHTTDKHLD